LRKDREAGEPAPRPDLPEAALEQDVELYHPHQQQHVHAQQEGRRADDPEGEMAVPVRVGGGERELHRHHGEQRLEAGLHPHQRPVGERVVEGGEHGGRQPVALPRRREVIEHQPTDGGDGAGEGEPREELHQQAAVLEGDRQQVDRHHQKHPERMGEPFDRLAEAGPFEPVPLDQVAGIGHRDHRVVEQAVVVRLLDVEGRAMDEPAGPEAEDEEQDGQAERKDAGRGVGHWGSWKALIVS